MTTQRLDHGMLNVPLSKRGDIDAQIDRYKRDQAKADRADRKTLHAQLVKDRAEAKRLISEIDPEFVARLAGRSALTPKQIIKNLNSDAHWHPAKILPALRKAVADHAVLTRRTR